MVKNAQEERIPGEVVKQSSRQQVTGLNVVYWLEKLQLQVRGQSLSCHHRPALSYPCDSNSGGQTRLSLGLHGVHLDHVIGGRDGGQTFRRVHVARVVLLSEQAPACQELCCEHPGPGGTQGLEYKLNQNEGLYDERC